MSGSGAGKPGGLMGHAGGRIIRVPKVSTGRKCPVCGTTFYSTKQCPTCKRNSMSFMDRVDEIREQEREERIAKEYRAYKQSQVVPYVKPLPLGGRLKCFFGIHDWKKTESSEARNHQLRELGIPLRASMAGWEKLKCKRCSKETTKVWTAF